MSIDLSSVISDTPEGMIRSGQPRL